MESRIEYPTVLSQEPGQTDLSNRAHNLAELDGTHGLIPPACLGQITQVFQRIWRDSGFHLVTHVLDGKLWKTHEPSIRS